jgi:hypothetical protein
MLVFLLLTVGHLTGEIRAPGSDDAPQCSGQLAVKELIVFT